MRSTTELAQAFIRHLNNVREGGCGDIDEDLIEWAFEGADYETETEADVIKAAQSTLERIDCAACAAPSGLIYNRDLAYRVAQVWDEIDETFADYHEETGERALPVDGTAITIGWTVWFAYEWRANSLAGWLTVLLEEGGLTAEGAAA